MLGLAPDVRIVDISHDIPPHDVRAGALLLVRAVQYLPDDCVVLAVVDPGVGTDRRWSRVEVDGRRAPRPRQRAARAGGGDGRRRPVGGRRSTTPSTSCPRPGPTFAGRDVLAPAAGHLAAGVPLGRARAAGRSGRAGARARVAARGRRRRRDRRRGVVGRPVRQLPAQRRPRRARRAAAPSPGIRVEVQLGGEVRVARWVHTYADAKPSELVLLVDSYGLLALALRPRVGGRRARPARRQRRSPWCPKAPPLDLTVRSEP